MHYTIRIRDLHPEAIHNVGQPTRELWPNHLPYADRAIAERYANRLNKQVDQYANIYVEAI